MILSWLILALFWYASLSTFDLDRSYLPDLAIGLSIWAAASRWDYNKDLQLALVVSCAAGLFSTEPWFFLPTICMLAVIVSSIVFGILSAQSFWRRCSNYVVILILLCYCEYLLRVSVLWANLSTGMTWDLCLKTASTLPLVLLLDRISSSTR